MLILKATGAGTRGAIIREATARRRCCDLGPMGEELMERWKSEKECEGN